MTMMNINGNFKMVLYKKTKMPLILSQVKTLRTFSASIFHISF